VITSIIIFFQRGRRRDSVWVLENRNKQLDQECRGNGRDAGPGNCALLIERLILDRLFL
jgi:hypothetical protein